MAKLLRRRFRRILIDVDTQYDLVYQNGQNCSDLLRNIRRLIAWSRIKRIPVISTALVRRQVTCPDKMYGPDAVCIDGSPGQKKIRYPMLPSNVMFGPENRFDLPRHILSDYRQVIFERRTEDPFQHPRADRLLSELKVDEFIVFGVALETAVRHTVLGLLRRGKQVLLVTDAVYRQDKRNSEFNIRKLEAKGAKRITTAALTGQSHLSGQVKTRKPWQCPLLINARIG